MVLPPNSIHRRGELTDEQWQRIHPLLPAQKRHDSVMFEALMAQGAVPGKKGRPRLRPKRVVADKAYSSGKIRGYLRRRGIRYPIPRKENEKHRGKFDKAIYRERN
jgi:transposase